MVQSSACFVGCSRVDSLTLELLSAELASSSFANTHQIVGPSGGAAVAFRKSMFTLKEEQALEGLAEGSDDYRGRGMLAVLSTRRWVPYPSDCNDKE